MSDGTMSNEERRTLMSALMKLKKEIDDSYQLDNNYSVSYGGKQYITLEEWLKMGKKPTLEHQEVSPRCADYEHDCSGITSPDVCWSASPERGYCPVMYGIKVENVK